MKLNINWAGVLTFVFFWSYGYFGALSSAKMGIFANILISLLLLAVFLAFIMLWLKRPEYNDHITLNVEDLTVFLSYFFIMLALSFKELTSPLVSDQIFHSQYSQLHAVRFIFELSNKTAIFDGFAFSGLLHVFNLMTLAVMAAVYYIFRKRGLFIKICAASITFILFRAVILKFGGYPDAHPPFRFFPLWLSSSILSCRSISFRIPQFLGLISIMWVSQRAVRGRLPLINSWLFGLAVGTIPVLWHVGTLAEPSIWTALIWTALLLYTARDDAPDNFNWTRWMSLVSIFVLMRQSAFIGLALIFLLYLIRLAERRRLEFKEMGLFLLPVLVMIPFLLKSIVFGTPATYLPGEVDFIPKDASGLKVVLIALTSGMAPKIILNSVTLPWLIFLPFAFIPLRTGFKKVIKAIGVSLFMAAAFYMFYSISPAQWGLGRYQAEYVVSFVVLGFFQLSTRVCEVGKIASRLLGAVFVFLLCFNIFISKNLYNFNMTNILSETAYSYSEALKAVKEIGYSGKEIIVGSTYGVFPEVMNGCTVSQASSARQIYKHLTTALGVIDFKLLNDDSRVKLVLISDISDADREGLISKLLSSGWSQWRNFRNPRSGTVIYGFIRS